MIYIGMYVLEMIYLLEFQLPKPIIRKINGDYNMYMT